MQLSYNFNYDLKEFKIILENNPEILNNKYYKSIICNLSALFLKTNKLGIITKNLNNKTLIIVNTKERKKLNMIITSSLVIVKINNCRYTFSHNINNNGIILNLQDIVFAEEIKFIESFLPHLIKFELNIKDKHFLLEVPLDIDYVIDKNIFKSINYNSTLKDLKKIYDNYLKKIQEKVNYNFYKMDTIIGIYKTNEHEKKSIIKKYRAGKEIYKEANTNTNNLNLNITLNENNEPIILIKGYNPHDNLNLNEEINKLYEILEINKSSQRSKVLSLNNFK